jgi:hypothetical protein
VAIPAPLPGGDALFSVEFGGQSFPLNAGEVFRFTDVTPAGVASFRITGIDVEESLSPDDPTAFVTGLTWIGDPQQVPVSFTMIPIVENTDDLDGDGVIASQDNCVEFANPAQSDIDQDGIGDACDTGQTPGEASSLEVLGHDAVTGNIAIRFSPACQASDHDLHFGPLSEVGSYGWSGVECSVGSSGDVAIFNPGPGSYFFVASGHAGGSSGSYGQASDSSERPATAIGECPRTQELTQACP